MLLGGRQNTIKSHLVFTVLFHTIFRFLQSYERALLYISIHVCRKAMWYEE
jgi:hypothetical protein